MKPTWTFHHPKMTMEHLGFIPDWLNLDDKRPTKDQLDSGYSFAGGWQPFEGFNLLSGNALKYPGDPPLLPLASTTIHEDTVAFYPHSWIAIIKPDGSFEACRMD